MDFITLANQFHEHILDNIEEFRSQFQHRFWSLDPSDIHIHHLEWLAQFLFFSYQDTPRFSDATQAFLKVFKSSNVLSIFCIMAFCDIHRLMNLVAP